jgi:hypothetical protein
MHTQHTNLRIWKDSSMNGAWRCSYRDGDSTIVVSFPDLKALGDFIADELGLSVIGALARSGDTLVRSDLLEPTDVALAY